MKFHLLVALPWAFAPHVEAAMWPVWIKEWKDAFIAHPISCLMAADYLIRNGVPRAAALRVMKDVGCDPLVLGEAACAWMVAKGFGTNVDDVDVALLLRNVRGGANATERADHV